MNAIYPSGKAALFGGPVDWVTSDIRCVIVTADYSYSATHDNLNDVAGGARVGSGAIANRSNTLGVLDGDDLTITGSGPGGRAIIVYLHTGDEATSTLLLYIDQGAGLPWPASQSTYPIQWSDGPNKIIALS